MDQSFSQDVCKLFRGWILNQAHVTVVDRFVGKVLFDVNVLCSLSAADDVVSPLDAVLSSYIRVHLC